MSEPAAAVRLPQTWRPFGARIAASVGGIGLLVVCLAAWVLFPPEIREKFTLFQILTMLFLGALAFSAWFALVRSRVVATETGLTVVNGYRRHDLEWAQVVSVHLVRGAPWATIDTSDGNTISLLAIQGSDGDRARAAVRTLRRLTA